MSALSAVCSDTGRTARSGRKEADPQMGQAMANALPVDLVEPVDISNAIVFLVSDDGRFVTGVTLPVDAGFTNKK
jgi:NAD(P)-dependent dehydrogenase (short-subunit alcohol dehydrogenase family)